MAAFQQDRRMIFLRESFYSTFHLSPAINDRLEQQRCFVEIWRDKCRERKQFVLASFNSLGFEKVVTTRRNHYRINDEWDGSRSFFFAVLNGLRDSANDFRRAEQTGFDRGNRESFEEHFNLLANHSRSCRFNP